MKILFLSKGDLPDFQSDMILHGLKSLYNTDVIDVNQCWYMYNELKAQNWNQLVPDNGKSYGMGFTLYGLLNNDIVDRTKIEQRIYNTEFDLIVYGSIQRYSQYLNLVLDCYPKEKIIFIDGEDSTKILWDLVDKGTYFKRELAYSDKNIHPINFCIPAEKIDKTPVKQKLYTYAHIIPGKKETYIYTKEEDYYKGYRDSFFGITYKKAGWDCLRHYEILANQCIPYFFGINNCPERTMVDFPKQLCNLINHVIEKITNVHWEEFNSEFQEHLNNKLTTVKVVEKMLNTI